MDTQDMLTGSPSGSPSLKAGSIRFVVAGQPQGKGRPNIVKIGDFTRMASPKKTVAYEGLIAVQAQIAMQHRDLIEGPVLVRIFIGCQVPASWSQKKQRDALAGLVFPTTKPDVDNVEKALFDGLNGVVWKDDVQVVDVDKTKRYSARPRLEVEVVPIAVPTATIKPASTEQLELVG